MYLGLKPLVMEKWAAFIIAPVKHWYDSQMVDVDYEESSSTVQEAGWGRPLTVETQQRSGE